jgi:hypothetical protein
VESSHVETKGLRWDFGEDLLGGLSTIRRDEIDLLYGTCTDWQTSFSTQISTSNHLNPDNDHVTIRTSRPVWWTMEIKDLNPNQIAQKS